MKCYSVTKWDEFFENNRTKGMVQMRWVPIPNKHDGEGFTDLIGRPNGMALYGAWILILQVASKCDKRGVLMKSNGAPHTAASIARQSRGNEKAIEQALPVLVEIGWLECKECNVNSDEGLSNPAVCPQSSGSLPAPIPHVADEGREGKGIEGKEGKEDSANAPCHASDFKKAWNELPPPFPKVRDWTDARNKALKARCADESWTKGYQTALQRMASSSFCRGKNDRNWIADVEFFLRPDTVTKILEGKYDDKRTSTGFSTAPPPTSTQPTETLKQRQDRLKKRWAENPAQKVGSLLPEVPT